MKKKELHFWHIWIACFVLAFIAVFMGFGNGVAISHYSGGEWLYFGDVSIYKLMFDKVERYTFNNWGALLAAFCCLITAIAAIITISVLNLCKITNKKVNLGVTIGIIVLLFTSGIIMLCARSILGMTSQIQWIKRYYITKLGYGSVVWGTLCMVASAGYIGSIFYNQKVLNNKF